MYCDFVIVSQHFPFNIIHVVMSYESVVFQTCSMYLFCTASVMVCFVFSLRVKASAPKWYVVFFIVRSHASRSLQVDEWWL